MSGFSRPLKAIASTVLLGFVLPVTAHADEKFDGLYALNSSSWQSEDVALGGFGVVDSNIRVLSNAGGAWQIASPLHDGLPLGVKQTPAGGDENRRTNGSMPGLPLADLPVKVKIERRGFLIGFDYRY